jgi:hypothetical protein
MTTKNHSPRRVSLALLGGLFGLAMTFGGVALRPASANGANGTPVQPFSNHTCASGNFCAGWTNTGSGNAIKVIAKNNTAAFAESDSSAAAGVYGHNPTAGYGMFADSNGGDAIKSLGGAGGRGLDAFGGGPGGVPAIAATALQSNVDLIDGYNATSTRVAELDDQGNLHLAGQIFTSGNCSAGCIKIHTAVRTNVTAYASAGTVPSIEDFGKAQIVDGRGYVRIAADFGQAIDPRSEYLVFLTPEGDNRGLYVTGKSASGFTVRESQGGHASLAVEYRIVARPYGSRESRLPVWSAQSWVTHAPAQR